MIIENKPKIFVKSYGCISNLLDGTAYEKLAVGSGYDRTDSVGLADLVMINTCAFNSLKEDEAIHQIEEISGQARADAKIIVCGCLPKINPERLKQIHGGITFGPRDPQKLQQILNIDAVVPPNTSGSIAYDQFSHLKKAIYQSKLWLDRMPVLGRLKLVRRLTLPHFIYSPGIYCLRVVTGCLGYCAYCAIRFAKGTAVSKPLDQIEIELQKALSDGYRRFVLVGDEITAYGYDLEKKQNIFDVIKLLLQYSDIDELYLESFEPSFMIRNFDELKQVLDTGKIPVFCSSAQSGSDRILRLMKRRYLAKDYIRCMKEIKNLFPKILLRSEMIVGFPGETEEDFSQSCALVRSLNIDFTDIYAYQDRPNTAATLMPEKVNDKIKRRRRRRLILDHWRRLILG